MIISDKTEFNKEEMVLIECDYKVSPKCKGIYYKMYKCILKGRENCEGKDRCISCFNSSTKTGKDNFNHKYDKDEDFFENIDSELKAYLLGWVAGDGSVKKDGIQLENHITDVSGLELFRENISPDAKFYKHADPIRGANTICLRINSVKIVSDLLRHLKLETYGKKSDKIQLPDLPDDLLWAFVRGLFDTDGCIISPSSKSTYPTSSICSTSKKMIHGLEELCDRNDIVYSSNEKRPTITFGGKNCLKFMEKIYGEANFFLQRKYDFWIIWKTWVPLYGTTFKPRKVREYYPPISEEQRQAIILSNKTRTISDDTKKKMSKSRIGKGSKISKEQSKEIVEFYSSGKYNMVELAKMYNVGFTTIHSIIHGTRKMDKEQSECQE